MTSSPPPFRRPGGADLPPIHKPWGIPSYRELIKPLLQGTAPRLRTELITAARSRRSNQHRAIRKLIEGGYLVDSEAPGGGKQVALAPGEASRLRKALRGAGSPPQEESDLTTAAGGSASGLTVVRATVAPDLIRAFGQALERQATQPGLIAGVRTVGQSHEYLLVAGNEPPGRSAALVDALRAAGADCARFQVWPGMDTSALRDHARNLQT